MLLVFFLFILCLFGDDIEADLKEQRWKDKFLP